MFQRKKREYSRTGDFFLGNLEEYDRREEKATPDREEPDHPAVPASGEPSQPGSPDLMKKDVSHRRAVRRLPTMDAPLPAQEPAASPVMAEQKVPPQKEDAAELPAKPEEEPKASLDIFAGLEDGFEKERRAAKKAKRTLSPAAEAGKPGETVKEECAADTGEEAPPLPFGATAFVRAFEEATAAPKPTKPRRARRAPKKEEKADKKGLAPHRTGKLAEYLGGEDQKKLPSDPVQAGVAAELKEMYGTGGKGGKRRALTTMDYVRYAILFVCLLGFFTAGYFLVDKLYDYYRGSALYKGLADMVSTKDRFAEDYLARSLSMDRALTLEDVYNGRTTASFQGANADADQQNLIAKITRLKEINPDTVGWISIENTVVNYPVVWSKTRNYYLRRDFYGKSLRGGTIFLDERNSPNIAENRNTVIYGHNMADGSMFASIHDFENASVFQNATIQIATTDAIYVYKPFSVHQSDAYDNYFETDFPTDRDFEAYLAEMQFISIYGTDLELDRNSQIITLSTCVSTTATNNDRFAVHAVLVEVIR